MTCGTALSLPPENRQLSNCSNGWFARRRVQPVCQEPVRLFSKMVPMLLAVSNHVAHQWAVGAAEVEFSNLRHASCYMLSKSNSPGEVGAAVAVPLTPSVVGTAVVADTEGPGPGAGTKAGEPISSAPPGPGAGAGTPREAGAAVVTVRPARVRTQV